MMAPEQWIEDPRAQREATAEELVGMRDALERIAQGCAVMLSTRRSGWGCDIGGRGFAPDEDGVRGLGLKNMALAVENAELLWNRKCHDISHSNASK